MSLVFLDELKGKEKNSYIWKILISCTTLKEDITSISSPCCHGKKSCQTKTYYSNDVCPLSGAPTNKNLRCSGSANTGGSDSSSISSRFLLRFNKPSKPPRCLGFSGCGGGGCSSPSAVAGRIAVSGSGSVDDKDTWRRDQGKIEKFGVFSRLNRCLLRGGSRLGSGWRKV